MGIRVNRVVLLIDSRSVVWVWTKLVPKARFHGGRTSTKPMLGVTTASVSDIMDYLGLPMQVNSFIP